MGIKGRTKKRTKINLTIIGALLVIALGGFLAARNYGLISSSALTSSPNPVSTTPVPTGCVLGGLVEGNVYNKDNNNVKVSGAKVTAVTKDCDGKDSTATRAWSTSTTTDSTGFFHMHLAVSPGGTPTLYTISANKDLTPFCSLTGSSPFTVIFNGLGTLKLYVSRVGRCTSGQ